MFVTKLTLKDSVRLSNEKALINAPAHYLYIEMMNKSFIIEAGQNSFVEENIFGTDPVARVTLCLANNEQFRGTRDSDASPYQPFGLQRLKITRGNGVASPPTPLDM